MFNNSNENTIKRFINAHQGEYKGAFKEIKNGKKVSHWIWYIFPQLKILGYSETAKYYGIWDFKESCNYLRNPLLFKHYTDIVELVESQLNKGIALEKLMGGEVDAKKLASSLTLFCATAKHLATIEQENAPQYNKLADCCERIFKIITKQGYYRCSKTQKIIEQEIKSDSTLLDTKPDSKDRSGDTDLNQTIITKKNNIDINQNPELTKTKTKTETETNQPLQKESPGQNKIKPDSLKNPLKPEHSSITLLNKKLDNYLMKRTKEWEFHSNFLGIIAVIYYLQDAITGSDHFSIKSRTTKISAATKLKSIIESTENTKVQFTPAETKALKEGRLGTIVAEHDGLEKIITQSLKESNQSSLIL